MSKSKKVCVYFNDEQFAQLKTKANINTSKNLSSYVRIKLLKINFQTMKKLIEIRKKLSRRQI